MNSPIVHSKQTMEFPSDVRDRIANASAKRNNPRAVQTDGTQQPAPRAQHNAAGISHNGRPPGAQARPNIDPQLTAIAQSTGAPGVYHNPMNPAHVQASYGPGPQAGGQAAPDWYASPRPTAAPVGIPTVKNPTPGFVLPVADANGTSVMLPSRFGFYGFQDLYIVPFKNAHLAKLSRAHADSNLQPIVEVVSTVIYTSTPGYSNLAFHLTMPDFFFVLYWLRQNSFTKTSYVHKDYCENAAHMARVEVGELEADSLKMTQIINNSTVKTLELEYAPDPEIFNFGEGHALRFSPPTMRDVLEFLDSPLMADANTRTEFSYLAQQAAHTQGSDQYLSLEERLSFVEELDLEQVQLLKQYELIMKSYGVQENVKMTCKVCGASKDSSLSLDASTFLSVEQP